jgi:hypothetical protein
MIQLGRKIYYDKATGNVIMTTPEMIGDVIEPTLAQDFITYTALHGIDPTTVGVLQVDYGQYSENFAKYPFHIDPSIQQIVWDTTPQLSLNDTINVKVSQLNDLCQQSLQTFTSNTLGTKHTYLSRSGTVNNDWALFNGEFSFVTSSYYDNLPILWYTTEAGNVDHTKEQFIQLFLNGRTAVALRKRQLAILESQAQSYTNSTTPTTDIANVNAIAWSDPWAQAPSVPTGLTGTAGSGQVTLTWTVNNDAVMANGGGYNVYIDGAKTSANTSLITSTTYTATGLSTGAHSFQISAVGANGIESNLCTAVSVTVS